MTRRLGWAVELGGVALAALLCSRGLDSGANYDEGVYLASADALGRGERLGEDVFASQPPGFYALVRLAVALPGDSIEATRGLFVAVAVLGVVAAWSLGRTLAGRLGGLGAAGVLLTAPAYAPESAESPPMRLRSRSRSVDLRFSPPVSGGSRCRSRSPPARFSLQPSRSSCSC